MPLTMTVSPDFKTDYISGWYIFNTWLQKITGDDIHLELVNDFSELTRLIDGEKVDLVYANPFDITKLVREMQFLPLTKPVGKVDEVVIITHLDSTIDSVDSLKKGIGISVTDSPDVNMVGMMLVESADIYSDDISLVTCSNHITVAKNVIQGKTEIGFMLADAYDDLSSLVKKKIKPLIRSKIQLLHHAFLVSPQLADKHLVLRDAMLSLHMDDKGRALLDNLGFNKWVSMDTEETEFMIDLMDTLQSE